VRLAEINNQTIRRNDALEEFAQCLKQLAEDKSVNIDTSR
jgi:hypothetical protein